MEKGRIPGGGNKYETEVRTQLGCSKSSRRASWELLGKGSEMRWAETQIIWIPEVPGGDSGFYSECRGKPSKNVGRESDIIRYIFKKRVRLSLKID